MLIFDAHMDLSMNALEWNRANQNARRTTATPEALGTIHCEPQRNHRKGETTHRLHPLARGRRFHSLVQTSGAFLPARFARPGTGALRPGTLCARHGRE